MTTDRTHNTAATDQARPQSASPPRDGRKDPFAEIIALSRQCPTRSRLHREALRIIVRSFQSPYGAVSVRYHSETLEDDDHTGPGDPNFWKSTVQQFLTESLAERRSTARLLKSRSGETRVALLAAPVYDPSGPAIGAVALVVHLADDTEWTARLATLEALCRLVSFCAEFVGSRSPEGQTGRSGDAALSKAAACESIEQFAFAVTNELCNRLGCNQVALATVEGHHVRIRSVSGMDSTGSRAPGVLCLKAALEECLDAGQAIVYQQSAQWSQDRDSADYRLHKQWHIAANGDAVASLPLWYEDRIVAVVGLRRSHDEGFTREQTAQLAARLAPLVPALALARKAHRSLPLHAADSALDAWRGLLRPGRLGRKLCAAAIVAAAAYLCFGHADHSVRVPCIVRPAEARHLSAPFEGVLASTEVVPGDRVRAGQILATFDARDWEEQRAELEAERTVWEREADRAMAENAPVEVQLARANLALVESKLEIVNSRIERALVRAPFDAVVIQGDLRKRAGDRLAEGEPLFQLAGAAGPGRPSSAAAAGPPRPTAARHAGWELELEVPEHAAALVEAGLSGEFASFAKPEQTSRFRIERIHPGAELRRDKNVYVARARVADGPEWLRPGMEGVARIDVGRRPVRWIAFHRIVDYLRLHFWL